MITTDKRKTAETHRRPDSRVVSGSAKETWENQLANEVCTRTAGNKDGSPGSLAGTDRS